MKILIGILFAISAWGAGSVTSTLTTIPGPAGAATYVLTYSWTGDASTGTVPATASPALTANPFVQGYYMSSVTITPGSPAPTSNYSVTVKDANGYDWLAGQAASLSATVATSYANTAAPPLSGSLTLAVTGNSVASARGTVVLFFAPTRTVTGAGWTDDGTNITAATGRVVIVGSATIDGTNGIKAPLVACVGAPGNTVGPYGSQCNVRATGALWGCTNAAGCTVSGDWAAAGGGGAPTFAACHAYTYTSGTLTVDLSSFPCSVITASGANPTLAFTAPTGATPLTIGLCNDATARTWTLPGTAKQFSVPFTLSTCAWNNGVVYDGANYQGPGTSDTPSILGFSAERAAPSVYPAGGLIYPNSTDHLPHSLNAAGDFAITRTVASGQTAMPTGALSANTCSVSATTATATGGATTDTLSATYASDPTGVTGYGGGTSGGITVRAWVTTNTANFKLCNESSGSITPGSLSVNWRITR